MNSCLDSDEHYLLDACLKADSHQMQRSAFSEVGCVNAEIGNFLYLPAEMQQSAADALENAVM